MPDYSHRVILSAVKDPRARTGTRLPRGFLSRGRGSRMTVGWVSTLPVRLLSRLIWVYQRTLSPALVVINPTCGCRFVPTCSHYAREALQEHGFFAGLVLTLARLAKCGPWHPGGEDPVPARKLSCSAVRP